MELKRKELLALKGHAKLIATHIQTKEQIVVESDNLIMTVGKTWLLNYMVNKPTYTTGFEYCALGDDDTEPSDEQTILVHEQIRRQLTQKDPITEGVEITLPTFFTASDSKFYIKEGGMFVHDATLTKDSGIMWSRFLLDFDNTGGEYDVTVQYILTLYEEEGS